MNERTAVGTVRCVWCRLEWIGDLEGHDDPQCLMFLFAEPDGAMLAGSTTQGDPT